MRRTTPNTDARMYRSPATLAFLLSGVINPPVDVLSSDFLSSNGTARVVDHHRRRAGLFLPSLSVHADHDEPQDRQSSSQPGEIRTVGHISQPGESDQHAHDMGQDR